MVARGWVASNLVVRKRNLLTSSIALDCHTPNRKLVEVLIIGYQLNWCLYGVLSVQVCESFSLSRSHSTDRWSIVNFLDIYSQTSARDSWKLKALVYGLFLVETAQIILASHDSFHQLALSWGVPSGLTQVYASWLTLQVLTGISTFAIIYVRLSLMIDNILCS